MMPTTREPVTKVVMSRAGTMRSASSLRVSIALAAVLPFCTAHGQDSLSAINRSALRVEMRDSDGRVLNQVFRAQDGKLQESLVAKAIAGSVKKSMIETGIENSAKALIECQKGAYPGATLGSLATSTPQSNRQPDHCFRF
jgi:hypothetical protein